MARAGPERGSPVSAGAGVMPATAARYRYRAEWGVRTPVRFRVAGCEHAPGTWLAADTLR